MVPGRSRGTRRRLLARINLSLRISLSLPSSAKSPPITLSCPALPTQHNKRLQNLNSTCLHCAGTHRGRSSVAALPDQDQ